MFIEFHKPNNTVIVEHANILPNGLVTARVLISLANKLQKFEYWHRQHGGASKDTPFVRHIQGEGGRVTATVQAGNVSLKMALRGDEWIVLGDALKLSD